MPNTGGSAGSAGYSYQHRVAAWFAAWILGESASPPLLGLDASTTFRWLQCESGQPVDDLTVGTSDRGRIFCQTKRNVSLTASADSELGKAFSQFVRQSLAFVGPSKNEQKQPPLDAGRDRLVLVCGSSTPKTIHIDLRTVLDRLRGFEAAEAIEGVAQDRSEERALNVLLSTTRSSWLSATGSMPTDNQLRGVLQLIHVLVLDCEPGGADERAAQHLLRESVLANPEDDQTCWAQLIVTCADLTSLRNAIGLKQLQEKLQSSSIAIQSARSYREDIRKLGDLSINNLKDLSYLGTIDFRGKELRIERDLAASLETASKEQSLLLIGEPGAGKSGALHNLARRLTAEGVDVLYLAADRLEAGSLGSLRAELGLSHEIGDVLENWQGSGHGVLLVDALDAARAEPSARTLRDLLRRVASVDRWRVVASVRKFDLRYSPEIQEIFRGKPPNGSFDPEFSDVRHVLVRRLSDAELAQVERQAPVLHAALQSVPLELLRVIFNLRILAELVNHGVEVRPEKPIRTQLELLELYWKYRVLDGPTRDARELILRLVAQSMLRNKTMRASRADIAAAAPSGELHELLSRGVLLEWQASGTVDRNKLAFSHHVVFDFAVCNLVFCGDDETFMRTLGADPQIVLIARPSLVFYYHHVWNDSVPSLGRFWNLVLRVQSLVALPTIGKLIGPSVGADRAEAVEDFGPLLEQLRRAKPADAFPEQVLGSTVGAVIADMRRVAGPDAGPWCALALQISYSMGQSVAYSLRALLSVVLEHPETLTAAQLAEAGSASRNLLEYAWSQPARDQVLVVCGIESVCKTFGSDPGASAVLLRRALEVKHVSEFGYAELPWLARQLSAVLKEDPSFVADVYRAAFGHDEASTEPVQIGSSRLLALTSTRRQDFEGARWELGRFFSAFVAFDAVQATSALICAVESYVVNERLRNVSAAETLPEVEEFDLLGMRARTCADYSGIWDSEGTHHHDDVFTMLDSFGDYLLKVSKGADAGERIREVVESVPPQNKWAVVWRRMLICGARDPTVLGLQLRELAWAEPILSGFDTSWAAGEFLRRVFPLLSPAEKERTERTILGLGRSSGAQKRDAYARVRDKLLGCLPIDELALDETKEILGRLSAAGTTPVNEPPFKMEFSSSAFGEKEYLEEMGVPVDSDENRWIRDLEAPVKDFAAKFLNAEPASEDLQAIQAPIAALWTGLSTAEARRVHRRQAEYAWGTIAEAVSRIPSVKALSCADPLPVLARGILLEASVHHSPEPDPEVDARFDESPSWGGPSARIAAAAGLIRMCRHSSCANAEVLQAVERLAADPVPAVRYQIASYLNALFKTGPDLMWKLATSIAREDPSRGVIQGLLVGAFQPLVRADPGRAVPLVMAVLDRVSDGPGARRVREAALEILAGLYIWRGNEQAYGRVGVILDGESADDPAHVLVHVRQAITYGPTSAVDQESSEIRRRALDSVRRLLVASIARINELQGRGTPFHTWPTEQQAALRKAVEAVDGIGRDVYFASGAFKQQTGETESVGPAQRQRFYREASEIIDLLCDCGIVTVTHHLLQTLESMVSFDPRGVFLRIGRVIQGGKQGGYQYESMAADLAVRLIERYLAEQRSLLEKDDECRRTLIAVLDAFVAAGWPAALRLSYRLEDIFR